MLKRLLGSRKWVTAVGALVLATGVIVWGWDEPAAAAKVDSIVNMIVILAALYIGGTTIEDAADKWRRGGPPTAL